jgi:hypothetical protein
MLTADDFRRIALAMPDAVEGAHMGHPDFRANDRIFASLHSRDQFGMVRLTPEQQRVVLRTHRAFVPCSGAWGRAGCTDVRLAEADKRAVTAAMQSAWENVMALAPARTKAVPSKKARRKTTTRGARKRPRRR